MSHKLFQILVFCLLGLCATIPLARSMSPANITLQGLDGFTVDALVIGEEVSSLVTEPEIISTMMERLIQAGIFADLEEDPEYKGGRLSLTFEAYSVEPVIPEDFTAPVRIYPISVYLSVSRPLYLRQGTSEDVVEGQVWWTHVEAWALENAIQEITCLAVHKALNRFVEAYSQAQQPLQSQDLTP